MRKRRKRQRGPRGEGYISYDARPERARSPWRAVVAGRARYFGSEAAAEAWRREELARLALPAPEADDPRRQPVSEALADLIEDRAYLAPSTEIGYARSSTLIARALGDAAVADVTPAMVAAMDRAHRQKYAAATADNILMLAGALYRRLLALQVVTFDPVAAYRAITPARARAGRPLREPQPLDPGMVRLLLRKLDGYPHTAVLWLVVTGLRIGELRGLRWANVRDGVAHIVEQRRATDRETPAPLKTDASARAIPIPAGLLAATPLTADADLVVTGRNGRVLNEHTLAHHMRKALVAARLPHTRIHDLRHTCGTGLLRLGCPERLVQYQLGHAPETMTGHYARPDAETLRPWVERWYAEVVGDVGARAQSGT